RPPQRPRRPDGPDRPRRRGPLGPPDLPDTRPRPRGRAREPRRPPRRRARRGGRRRMTRRPRIVMTSFGFTEPGGGTLVPRTLAAELVRRGWDVTGFYAGTAGGGALALLTQHTA